MLLFYFYYKAGQLNLMPIELLETAYMWKFGKWQSMQGDLHRLKHQYVLPQYTEEYLMHLKEYDHIDI